jgi:hypothetical protein
LLPHLYRLRQRSFTVGHSRAGVPDSDTKVEVATSAAGALDA